MAKIFTVTLPDIGEGVVEGEVISWLKQVNDPLQQDEPVVIVMTDKATVELPAPYPGRLVKQHYKPGDIAYKDKPLYDIEVESEIQISEPQEERKKETPPQTTGIAPSEIAPSIPSVKPATAAFQPPRQKSSSKALAAPPVRKMAHELGIDINQITGTGPEGHVTKEDLAKYHSHLQTKAAASPPLRLPDDQEVPVIGIRSLMARRMAEANELIPHFSYFEQLDATRLVQLRLSYKEEAAKEGIHITYMPFIIKALSLSLVRFPTINGSFDAANNTLILHKQHNIGIAISTKLGLIVPVLKNVQNMSLHDIIRAYDRLKTAALNNKLQPSDMKESTITITNFGVLGGGGMWATPIINYPEAAILGINRIHKQAVVRNDQVVIRDILNLSWSFDHRIVDGELAATFSHHLCTLLQNPAPLI